MHALVTDTQMQTDWNSHKEDHKEDKDKETKIKKSKSIPTTISPLMLLVDSTNNQTLMTNF